VDGEGLLAMQRIHGLVRPLLAESETQFFEADSSRAYRFEIDEAGRPERLVTSFGGGLGYRRVSDLESGAPSAAAVERVVGRYRMSDLAVGIIEEHDGQLYWVTEGATVGTEPLPLHFAGPDRLLFGLDDRMAELLLRRDATGLVSELVLREGMLDWTYPRCGPAADCLESSAGG
jgi:hypothetical protein